MQKQAPKLPDPPVGGFRDIGLLSFGDESKQEIPDDALGSLGEELAASAAAREQVIDTRVSPFRKICDLVITPAVGDPRSGTAWFITPRMLVTAGHCLFVSSPGTSVHGMVRKVLVMPARNGETDASQSLVGWVEVNSASLRVHDRWRLEGNLDFDYGVIILPPDQALGAEVGIFKVRHFADGALVGAQATVSGYPDNVSEGTQWMDTDRITNAAPAHLLYDVFTSRGQSGSPVFFGGNEGQTACGIHSFGTSSSNRGVRINPSVIAQLNVWKV